MVTNKYKILLFLAIFLLGTSIVQAYCPPYFAKIDSIEPEYPCLDINDDTHFCGGSLSIYNNCEDTFYYYDNNGNIDKSHGLIPKKIWENQEERDPNFMPHDYPDVGHYLDCREYIAGSQKSIIVDGIDVCNETAVAQAGSGTVVKYWTLKLYSEKNQEDIVIKGRTIYEPPANIGRVLFYISILFFIISGTLLFAKYGLKKKIHISIPIILIVFGIFLFLLYFMSPFIIG